jgi:hypothetical protein
VATGIGGGGGATSIGGGAAPAGAGAATSGVGVVAGVGAAPAGGTATGATGAAACAEALSEPHNDAPTKHPPAKREANLTSLFFQVFMDTPN